MNEPLADKTRTPCRGGIPFGPSNLKALAKYPTIISKMKQFHQCSNHVLDYARNKSNTHGPAQK
jgi:hypothetical protein